MAKPSTSSPSQQIGPIFFILSALLPVFFLPPLFNAYRLPREALAAFVAAILGLFWLLSIQGKPQYARPYFPLLPVFALLFASSAISLIHAVNLYDGIFKTLGHAVGYILFYTACNFLSRELFVQMLRWLSFSGACVSLVGILQTWGFQFSFIYEFAAPASLFGNKNMAAHFLIYALPACAFMLVHAATRQGELVYAAILSLVTSYLTYTWARSSWGAMTVALILTLALLLLKRVKSTQSHPVLWRKAALLLGVIAFVVFMNIVPQHFVSNWRAGWTVGSTSGTEHLENAMSLTGASAQARFVIWRNTLAMFTDHMLTGIGVGNFPYVYPQYCFRSAKDLLFNVDIKAAETHNDYLQILAERGILGMAAFALFLAALAYRIWRVVRTPFDRLLVPIIWSILAMLLLAFWDFPFAMPVPSVFFWIYAGALWKLPDSIGIQGVREISRNRALGILVFLTACAGLVAMQSLRHTVADYYFARSLQDSERAGDASRTLARQQTDAEKAVHHYPYDYRYPFQKALFLTKAGKHNEAVQANLSALALNPNDINTLNNLGVNFAALGRVSNAIAAYERAVRIWPAFLDANNSLAALYEISDQKDKAIATLQHSLAIKPDDQVIEEKLNKLIREKGR